MKTKASLLALFIALCTAAHAAVFVTAGSVICNALVIHGADGSSANGILIYAGLGDAPSPSWAGKIVLVDRGAIPFGDKIANVKQAGGLACIIANNVFGDFEFTSTASTLPAFSISQADGLALRAKAGTQVFVGAAVSPPPALAIPDPTGHAGETILTDGARLFWSKLVYLGGSSGGSVKSGNFVTLLASSDGTPPLSFQWAKDGADIAGAIDSQFTIAAAGPGDAGDYTCRASNPSGSANSGPYKLGVTP